MRTPTCWSCMTAASSSALGGLSTKRASRGLNKGLSAWTAQRTLSTSGPARRPEEASSPSQSPSASGSPTSPPSRLSASLLLVRSPFITRSPTPFEDAFHIYQQKLRLNLSKPFPTEFYFKKGSAGQRRWEEERKKYEERIFASPSEAAEAREEQEQQNQSPSSTESLAGAEGEAEAEAALLKPLPRTTAADEANDVQSLDRKLDRSLYLLVRRDAGSAKSKGKGKEKESWVLPTDGVDVEGGEALHQTASRALHTTLGRDMDVWLVGNAPIGVYDGSETAEKVFVMKAHMLAGQASPIKGTSTTGFAWLTKEEVRDRVEPEYWTRVEGLLSDL